MNSGVYISNLITFIINNIILALIVGLIANAMFLIILSKFFRPRIQISQEIARCYRNGSPSDRIKVINRTNVPLTDIKVQLDIVRPDGNIMVLDPIELVTPDLISIDKYDKKDTIAGYARRFRIKDNLDNRWTDDSIEYLRFRIFARHSVSGLGELFTQEYRTNLSIKHGKFAPRDETRIIEENC
jgi:hypothetical protein